MKETKSEIGCTDIQAVYNMIDINNDGMLSRQELRTAFMKVPGIDSTEIE